MARKNTTKSTPVGPLTLSSIQVGDVVEVDGQLIEVVEVDITEQTRTLTLATGEVVEGDRNTKVVAGRPGDPSFDPTTPKTFDPAEHDEFECRVCHEVKPATSFAYQPNRTRGTRCRSCSAIERGWKSTDATDAEVVA